MNPFENPTPINNNELIKEALLKLSAELGFIQNEEALSIKNSFEYEKGFEENREKYITWRECVETELDKIEDKKEREKAQMGLDLVNITMYKDFNILEEDDFADIIEEASSLELHDVVSALQDLRDTLQ